MGRKKKSVKKVVVKTKPTVPKSFKCPLCYTDGSVDCDLNFVDMKGVAACSACKQEFACNIHSLSAPVDVFHDWLDALEEDRKAGVSGGPSHAYAAPLAEDGGLGHDVFEDVRELKRRPKASRKRARTTDDAAAARAALEKDVDAASFDPTAAPGPALDDNDDLFGAAMADDDDGGELMFNE